MIMKNQIEFFAARNRIGFEGYGDGDVREIASEWQNETLIRLDDYKQTVKIDFGNNASEFRVFVKIGGVDFFRKSNREITAWVGGDRDPFAVAVENINESRTENEEPLETDAELRSVVAAAFDDVDSADRAGFEAAMKLAETV